MNPNDNIKIIIADDSPKYIEGLKVLLSTSSKYQILEVCENGRELIQSSKLHLADLLLIDINMPEMNGLEAARIIDVDYPHLPMIAITMYQDELYLKDIISMGFNAFVHKPEAANNLLIVIDQVLNKKFVFPNNLKTQ
ncbi:MAG: response regulator transcription factor [Bacteroidota bacterium]